MIRNNNESNTTKENDENGTAKEKERYIKKKLESMECRGREETKRQRRNFESQQTTEALTKLL